MEYEEKYAIKVDDRLKKLGYRFSSLRQKYSSLRRKLGQQRGKQCSFGILVKLYFMEEEMDHLSETLEETLAALDEQGYWELNEEDKERLENEKKSRDLFYKYLPIMMKDQENKHTTSSFFKDIKGKCVIL